MDDHFRKMREQDLERARTGHTTARGVRYVLAPWTRMRHSHGDIARALSPQEIQSGKLAGIFRLGTRAYTAISGMSNRDLGAWERIEAVEIRPLSHWDGEPTETYDMRQKRANRTEMDNRRTRGLFYNGIRVRHQGEDLVIGGDKITIICAEPTEGDGPQDQGSLFG